MQWVLEIGLIGLLIATLVHAVRLGRALALLRRDRGPLEELVQAFAASTREAQAGVDQLRQTADGAGRRIAQQIEVANTLRDDLAYMTDRAERLADRLDLAVRGSRPYEAARFAEPPARPVPQIQSGFVALPGGREAAEIQDATGPVKVRSQAERDLMQALRLKK